MAEVLPSSLRTETPVCNEPVVLNPLQERAWDSLVAAHPESNVFHSASWARVLHETYGHRPIYFCRFEQERLAAMLPVMEVSSPWTGERGVSLPFTDFCPLLRPPDAHEGTLYNSALELGHKRHWRYLQCRSGYQDWPGASPSLTFYGHVVDLSPGPGPLFQAFGPAVRRNIRKAQAAEVEMEFGSSEVFLRTFYALHCRTRRRHGLPPQPFRFFAHIGRHLLERGNGFVAVARLGQQPLAAAVFLEQGQQALYKFGASDERFQQVRPNNLLMWGAIQRCAAQGRRQLHLGRTSLINQGLRSFKLGFAAREERLDYCHFDFKAQAFVTETDRAQGWFNHFFRLLPPPFFRLAGQLLYPHLS